jgi:hypothetical protein
MQNLKSLKVIIHLFNVKTSKIGKKKLGKLGVYGIPTLEQPPKSSMPWKNFQSLSLTNIGDITVGF